jgi:hypothetical protein
MSAPPPEFHPAMQSVLTFSFDTDELPLMFEPRFDQVAQALTLLPGDMDNTKGEARLT